jgi:hypothetical protein
MVAHGPKFTNVSRTLDEDRRQRDKTSDQRHRRSYPEHSGLSVERSVFDILTMPFWYARRF